MRNSFAPILKRPVVISVLVRLLTIAAPLEASTDVTAEGIASCGDLSIADCKAKALVEAKRAAIESGTAVFIESSTVIENFQLSSDVVRSRVRAKILGFDVLESGLIDETGYRYLINARVTPDLTRVIDHDGAREASDLDDLIGGLPRWIMAPDIEGSFAASSCVASTGSMNLDRRMASANARAEIAQIVAVNVITLEEAVESFDGAAVALDYEAQNRSLSAQALNGSEIKRAGYYEIDQLRQFCAMVAMPEGSATALFDALVEGLEVEPQQRERLKRDFVERPI